MTKKKTPRFKIILAALGWLRLGLLPSALPLKLMRDYDLSDEAAREISQAAVEGWRAERQPSSEENEGKESEPGQPDNE
jgi:hypothetical protein